MSQSREQIKDSSPDSWERSESVGKKFLEMIQWLQCQAAARREKGKRTAVQLPRTRMHAVLELERPERMESLGAKASTWPELPGVSAVDGRSSS